MRETVNIALSGGTPGANTTELTIFDSTVALGGIKRLPLTGIKRLTLGGHNSHAGHVKAYFSTDGGTNWDQFDDDAVSASSSTAQAGPLDYDVAPYLDVKLTWTNDASTAMTSWRMHLMGHYDRAPGA